MARVHRPVLLHEVVVNRSCSPYSDDRTFTDGGEFPSLLFLRGSSTPILLLTTILIIYTIHLPCSKPEGASCTSVFAKVSPTMRFAAWSTSVACPRCASFATNSACPPNAVVAPAALKTSFRRPSLNARDVRRTLHSPQPPDWIRLACVRPARTAHPQLVPTGFSPRKTGVPYAH